MRIFSGIQPTGNMHIGNLLGAGRQYLEFQQKGEFFLMVADLHALTLSQNPETFRQDVLNKIVELLAIGVDPSLCTLFVQSHVKEHTELAWILNTITPLGELERMTQYKDKAKKHSENVNAGLLDYPVLMASDILLYKTDVVPVGQDQTQHVELTRTIARKFNTLYGQTFPEPKTIIPEMGAKIMSLKDPKKKMSKSDGPEHMLGIFEDPASIQKKVMAAVTDTGKTIEYNLEKKPGISNLLTMYSLFANQPVKAVEKKFKGKGYAQFKKALAELLVTQLEPLRKKKKKLESREVYVQEILRQGAAKARGIAFLTMDEVRKKVGLLEI